MSRRAPVVAGAAALVTLGLTALALGAGSGGPAGAAAPRLAVVRAGGSARLSDSREGQAILTAPNLAPGHPVSGAVTIGDEGSAPGALSLSLSGLADAPGPNGGRLSSDLRLMVRDVTGGSDAVLYRGPLEAMPRLRLGILGPGRRRQYAFQALLPSGEAAAPDNSTEGSQSGFSFGWSLAETRVGPPCLARLPGGARSNVLLGTVGGDLLTGYLGADDLRAGSGEDCLGGGPGPDRLWGGRGADRVRGGPGDDSLAGGPGRDRISGGPGADVIHARDGSADRIDCGPGYDRAVVDAVDRLRPGSCEVVEVGR